MQTCWSKMGPVLCLTAFVIKITYHWTGIHLIWSLMINMYISHKLFFLSTGIWIVLSKGPHLLRLRPETLANENISHTSSTWWRHQMETFSALLAICEGNSPVTGEFLAQRPVTRSLMFSLICAWISGWVNNREDGDLRQHLAHYDVTVMKKQVQLAVHEMTKWKIIIELSSASNLISALFNSIS